jgi:hypothetical protein
LKLLFDFDFIDEHTHSQQAALAEGLTTYSQVYWERSRSGVTTKHTAADLFDSDKLS